MKLNIFENLFSYLNIFEEHSGNFCNVKNQINEYIDSEINFKKYTDY